MIGIQFIRIIGINYTLIKRSFVGIGSKDPLKEPGLLRLIRGILCGSCKGSPVAPGPSKDPLCVGEGGGGEAGTGVRGNSLH